MFLLPVAPLAMGSGKHLLLIAVLPLLVRCEKPKVYIVPAFEKAFIGDSVYLKCNKNEGSVKWYKNNEPIDKPKIWKIEIENKADAGPYNCETSGIKSDDFNINVVEPGDSAKLSIETGLRVMSKGGAVILRLENGDSLKGWRCWVCRDGEQPRMVMLNLNNSKSNNIISFQTADLNVPETIYWCTDRTRTYRTKQIILETSDPPGNFPGNPPVGGGVMVGLFVGLVVLGAVLVGVLLVVRRKRTATGRVYEEVALSSRKQGDDKYETLQEASGREREYDTLNPGASGSQTKSGEYEALKKEGMKEGVYHTLGVEGAAGGEGGYEALKKEGMKEGVYHTLGAESQQAGEGGCEAVGTRDKGSDSATVAK